MAISAQQYAQLQERLASRRPQPALGRTVAPSSSEERHQIVLGIDPSLRGTGYGVIDASASPLRVLTQGTVVCPASWEASRCLVAILHAVRDAIRDHQPTLCVVEGIFFAQNLKTALIMGQARGASMVAAAEAGLVIHEIATRKVKQSIVGYGAAQKFAVAKMVQRRLSLAEPPSPDAADALALALSYLQSQNRYNLTPRRRL